MFGMALNEGGAVGAGIVPAALARGFVGHAATLLHVVPRLLDLVAVHIHVLCEQLKVLHRHLRLAARHGALGSSASATKLHSPTVPKGGVNHSHWGPHSPLQCVALAATLA